MQPLNADDRPLAMHHFHPKDEYISREYLLPVEHNWQVSPWIF